MNKRTRKKHEWLGAKRAGAYYCANQIARHIGRKISYSEIVPKSSYRRNIRSYVHWFFLHSSEEEWSKRADEAYYPKQMFLSAKHLLASPNPPIKINFQGGKITCSEAWMKMSEERNMSISLD